jgi:hypothetical protein
MSERKNKIERKEGGGMPAAGVEEPPSQRGTHQQVRTRHADHDKRCVLQTLCVNVAIITCDLHERASVVPLPFCCHDAAQP